MTVQQALTLIGNAPIAGPAPDRSAPASSADHPSAPDRSSAAAPVTWADLGCGDGLFTRALAHLLPAGSTIYGIDRQPAFQRQTTPEGVTLIPQTLDFVKDPPGHNDLDGILMANSLHYVSDKPALIRRLRTGMRPAAPFLIVEYDTDQPVPTWVPYPLSFDTLDTLFRAEGYTHIQQLGTRPSVYGRADLYAVLIR